MRIANIAVAGFLILAMLPLLSACETPPAENRFPALTFEHLPAMNFNVGEVRIEDRYDAPGAPPNVEHVMPVAPATAAANWGRNRLVASGVSKTLVYRVREGSVVETSLDTNESMTALLTTEQSERYKARVVVEMEIQDANGFTESTLKVTAERSVTVPEDSTLNDRDAAWFTLTDKLMNDLNEQLERTIREVMGIYLI
jgi:hypothetical protein